MPNIRIPAGYKLTLDDLRREPGGLHRTFIALAALDVAKSYDKAEQLIRDAKLRLPYRVGDYQLSEARDLLKLLGAPLVHPDDQVADPILQTAAIPRQSFDCLRQDTQHRPRADGRASSQNVDTSAAAAPAAAAPVASRSLSRGSEVQ